MVGTATGAHRADREACDHAHHAVALLNDKTDGLYDELLPNAVIILEERHVGRAAAARVVGAHLSRQR